MAAKRLIGYLPENAPAYPDMTVDGFLSFAAEMRGLTARQKGAVHRAVEMCFLESVLHQSDRHPVQGLQASHLLCAIHYPRS